MLAAWLWDSPKNGAENLKKPAVEPFSLFVFYEPDEETESEVNMNEKKKFSSEKYVGYSEAADIIGCSVGHLYSLVHRKIIPHFRLSSRCVRFDRNELESFMALSRVPAKWEDCYDGESF